MALLLRLDAMVIEASGLIYLGKDSYTESRMFCTMFSESTGLSETKARNDPRGYLLRIRAAGGAELRSVSKIIHHGKAAMNGCTLRR